MARRFDRLGWAMDQSDLTPTQRFVLLILADMADEYGLCWPSKATVAERTGFSTATVKRSMRELADLKVLISEPHFMTNGKQTSNSIRLCLGGRGVTVTPPEDGTNDTPSTGSRGVTVNRGGGHSDPDVEPPSRTSRNKKNSTASQKSPSRRASRARAEDTAEWSDPAAAVFAKEQVAPTKGATRGGPDSAWALNGYYRQTVFIAGSGRVGNTNDGAMRKYFAEAKRVGVPADTLRKMVDCFVEDQHLFNRTRTHRWKVFIANAPLLQDRAENLVRYIQGEGDDIVPIRPSGPRGSVPKAVLDKILAEAG